MGPQLRQHLGQILIIIKRDTLGEKKTLLKIVKHRDKLICEK